MKWVILWVAFVLGGMALFLNLVNIDDHVMAYFIWDKGKDVLAVIGFAGLLRRDKWKLLPVIIFFTTKINMGTVVRNSKSEHKQPSSMQHFVPMLDGNLLNHLFNRAKMAEVKALLLFTNILGFTLTGVLSQLNLNTAQGWVVFFLVCLFWGQKIYFNIRKNQQDIKNRSLSLRKKEHDIDKEMEEDD